MTAASQAWYKGRVDGDESPRTEPQSASTARKARRRRPPSLTEQNRRVAWGKRESAQEVQLKEQGRWKEQE